MRCRLWEWSCFFGCSSRSSGRGLPGAIVLSTLLAALLFVSAGCGVTVTDADDGLPDRTPVDGSSNGDDDEADDSSPADGGDDDATPEPTFPPADPAPYASLCQEEDIDEGPVWEGDYTISSSEDIAALEGYTRITGELTIVAGDGTVIPDLTGLESLRRVDRDLDIRGYDGLYSLDGLEGLTLVCGSLRLGGEAQLDDIDALQNVQYVDTLSLYALDGVSDLSAFSGLVGAADIYLQQNAALTSLHGLEQITWLSTLDLERNPLLTSLEAMRNLTQLTYELRIVDNPLLTGLDGLERVEYAWKLAIEYNDGLQSLDALAALRTTRYLYITDNASLASLTGLRGLTWNPDNLEIEYNDSLTTLEGLENITETIDLNINGNEGLVSLTGLEHLNRTGGLLLTSNPALVDVEGLAGLEYLDEDLWIEYNQSLTSLAGLSGLELGEAARLFIRDNDSLLDLQGLEQITSISELGVSFNDALHSLEGLDGLQAVGYGASTAVEIGSNYSLLSVDGLEALTRIEGDLHIDQNTSLLNLDGLAGLTTLNGDLFVETNPSLPACEAEALKDQLRANGWTGQASIYDNGTGSCE